MEQRIAVGLFFLTCGLIGLVVSFAYALSGGDPFETDAFSRRTPGSLTITSLGGVALGITLLFDVGPVTDLILD